jgi:hypothetical protein
MSEYINNCASARGCQTDHPPAAPGRTGKTAGEYGHIIAGASAQDIAAAEREVIDEGAGFGSAKIVRPARGGLSGWVGTRTRPETNRAPSFRFRTENELIERTLEAWRARSCSLPARAGDFAQLRENAKKLDLILCILTKKRT